jgi:hypothetical protein
LTLMHTSGVIKFGELQTRAEIKVELDREKEHMPEETFKVVLTDAHPTGAMLGRKTVCAITILNDERGLPERLRVDWSRYTRMFFHSKLIFFLYFIANL